MVGPRHRTGQAKEIPKWVLSLALDSMMPKNGHMTVDDGDELL